MSVNYNEAKIKEWVSKGLDRPAVEFAEAFGRELVDEKLSTAQIRNVFGEVRRIQMKMMDRWEDPPVLPVAAKIGILRQARDGENRGGEKICRRAFHRRQSRCRWQRQ
jgi:CRISPR-associated protein Csm2